MTNNEHKDLIVILAKLFRPGIYVELGVGTGYVFNAVLPYVRSYAVGVDISLDSYQSVRDPSQAPTKLYEMPTSKAVKLWPDNLTIDMLFIDADHKCEAVMDDFVSWAKLVTPGTGLILLHDTHPHCRKFLAPGYCNDAWKTAATIYKRCQAARYEIVTLPGPRAGLSIIRKLTEHYVAWMGE